VQSLLQAIGPDRGKAGAGAAPLQLRITEGIEPNTVIVRGSERDIAVVAEVVKALDVPEDQLQPMKLLGLQLLPVPTRIQSRVNDIIDQLELLPLKSMNVGKTSVLVFRDSGKELDELIKLLNLKAAPATASTGTR
jgi:hypothetical protein